jgi:membrane protease YdiL (CAAX protease family)
MSTRGDGLARRIVMFPLVRIVVATVPIVVFLAGVAMATAGRIAPHSLAGGLVPVGAGCVVLAIYAAYVRLVERRPVTELDGAGAFPETASGFVVGLALFSITIAILVALGVAHVGRGDGLRALLLGFTLSLGAAMAEETMVRAIFFRIVEGSLGTAIAIALSALLFGFLHAANPGASVVSSVAIALEAGVLLAAVYVFTRRLWMCMGVHAAWNFAEGGVFGASVSGNKPYGLFSSTFTGAPLLSGGKFGPEASLVAVVVCLAAGVLFALYARRRGNFVRPLWARSAA